MAGLRQSNNQPAYRPGGVGAVIKKKNPPIKGNIADYSAVESLLNSAQLPPEVVAQVNQMRQQGVPPAQLAKALAPYVADYKTYQGTKNSIDAYDQYKANMAHIGRPVDNPAGTTAYRPASYGGSGATGATNFNSGASSGNVSNIQKQLQAQQDAANRANEQRYQQLLSGNATAKQELLNTLSGNYNDQLAGATAGLDEQLTREGKRLNYERGSVDQNAMSRGLQNTTIKDSLNRGVVDASALRERELQDAATQRKLALQQAYSDKQLGIIGQLYGDRSNIIQGRTDQGPDMAQWMNLLSQAGAGGGTSYTGRPQYAPGSAEANYAANRPASDSYYGSAAPVLGVTGGAQQLGNNWGGLNQRYATPTQNLGNGQNGTLVGGLGQAGGYQGQFAGGVGGYNPYDTRSDWEKKQDQLRQSVQDYYNSRAAAGTAPWQGGRTAVPSMSAMPYLTSGGIGGYDTRNQGVANWAGGYGGSSPAYQPGYLNGLVDRTISYPPPTSAYRPTSQPAYSPATGGVVGTQLKRGLKMLTGWGSPIG